MTAATGRNISLPRTASRLERFDAKWVPEPNSGCHLWIGGTNEHGYGVFWNGERLEKAHRFAFNTAIGGLSDGADLCHRCDTPSCVNVAHMFVGDAASNVADMWSKSRAAVVTCRGVAQPQAKLDDVKAAAIRAEYALGGVTQRELARIHGVSQTVIWRIVHALLWAAPSGMTTSRGRAS